MKFKIKLQILILTVVAMSFIVLGGSLLLSKAETNIKWENQDIQDFLQGDFKVNDTVELPIATRDGKTVSYLLYSPSGEGYVSNKVKFIESGQWKLQYDFESGKKEYSFIVKDILYSVNGTKSMVGVGKASEFTSYNAENQSGAYMKIYEKESITYRKKIDLSGKTIDNILLRISTLPEVIGSADANRLIITFTDAYDPSNYVTVMMKNHESTYSYYNRYTYVEAGATGQEGMGLERRADGDPYEGDFYVLHKGFYTTDFGALVIFSMTGMPNPAWGENPEDVGTESFDISIDYEQKRVYCNRNLIIDLDDPTYQSVLWDGFTTGECYITISADTYKKAATNILITKIDGEPVTELIANYETPEIKLKDVSMESVKDITVGKKFPVPECYATDILGNELEIDVNVYTGYKLGSQANVPIVDGYFTPLQTRDYYVVYDCTDNGGNHSQKILIYSAKNIDISLKASINGYKTECVVGETVDIVAPMFTNNIGNINVKVSAKKDNERILIAEYSVGDTIPELRFTPVKTGVWTIEYEYSDKYSSGNKSYALSVKVGGKNFFIEKPVLPKYIIKDAAYKTSFIKGYDFSGGDGALKVAKVYLSQDGNYLQGQLLEDNTFIVSQTSNQVYFTYVLGSYYESYVVPVVDVNYGKSDQLAENYFVGYSGTPILDKNMGATYTVKKQDGKYRLSFINLVQCYEFSFGFKIPSTAKYNKLSIYLEDSIDNTNILKCSVYRYNDKNYFCINDGSGQQIKADYNESIIINYTATSNLVSLSSGEGKSVFTNLNGNKWNGFSNNTCWLTVEIEDTVETTNEISIERVNNQLFYQYKRFKIFNESPEIYQRDISGDNKLNNVVSLPNIVVADVFATYATVKLVVKTPTGEYVVSEDGTTLNESCDPFNEYSFVLNEYGSYYIAYSVEDDLGGANYFKEYNINVIDNMAPIITLDTTRNTRFKLGDEVKIADYTVKDDVTATENCKVFIIIARPDLKKVVCPIDGSDAMKFEMKGEYTVWISVTDEANNMTFASYKVSVL